MAVKPKIDFLLELEPEEAQWRRRAMFLLSVLFHGFLLIFLAVAPDLFRRGARIIGIQVEPVRQPQFTYLWIPAEVLRRLQEPPPDTTLFSDRDRRAQGPSPVIDPDGIRMPYLRGNTTLPEIAGGGTEPEPSAAGTRAIPPTPEESRAASTSSEKSGLRLEDVRPSTDQEANPSLPFSLGATPGQAIQDSLQAALRGRGGGGGPGPGDSITQLENLRPNFSTEAPIILSDTRGVDFGPYLARLVYIVRRNWYAVIPESARLGERGRVAIVFEILRDGTVPQLRLLASSGSPPLDRAALAGIRSSIPFPPLPEEFTGEHLVLQFIFLYNMGYVP